MSAERIPLSNEDRAILELESERVAGHCCKVVVLRGEAPGLEELRGSIAGRIAGAPELTRRLSGTAAAPAWVQSEEFDPAPHVVGVDRAPVDEAGLRELVAELFAERLDRDRPLWRLDVAALSDGGRALIWRLHHALADGTTAVRLARTVLFDDTGDPGQVAHRPAAEDDARRRIHLVGFLEREFARSRASSPFDAAIGPRRVVGFARAPLADLHDAAKALAGATVNDAVLAAVGGGLRRWIEKHHGPLGDLRVKVPVSLHHQGDTTGNRDSFFTLPLPLRERDPVARLRTVHERTAERKADDDARELDSLLRSAARISPRLERAAERLERSPRSFALNVSNVPGPRDEVKVLGAPVSSIHTLAEIGEHHALRVAVLSYAGELGFGLCADPDVVPDLDDLARGIEEEAEELTGRAAAGGTQGT
jgi:diacylglycerol O-acyltransferase / wax synthase